MIAEEITSCNEREAVDNVPLCCSQQIEREKKIQFFQLALEDLNPDIKVLLAGQNNQYLTKVKTVNTLCS